jgi:hypothetical protein
MHEPHREGLGGRHRAAGQHHLERACGPDDRRQELRAGVRGQQPELDLGQRHRHVRRGEPQRAGHRELEPAAVRQAVDRRDRHQPGARQPHEQLARHRGLRHPRGHVEALQLAEVGARAERALAAAGDDQQPRPARLEIVDAGRQPQQHRLRQRIELHGAFDGEDGAVLERGDGERRVGRVGTGRGMRRGLRHGGLLRAHGTGPAARPAAPGSPTGRRRARRARGGVPLSGRAPAPRR